MRLNVAEMLDKLHVIIDDVRRTDGEDDFSEDKDTELREALLTGADLFRKPLLTSCYPKE